MPSPKEYKQMLIDEMKSRGYSNKAIANILASVQGETGFNPRAEGMSFKKFKELTASGKTGGYLAGSGLGKGEAKRIAQSGSPEELKMLEDIYNRAKGYGLIQHTTIDQKRNLTDYVNNNKEAYGLGPNEKVDFVMNPKLLNDPRFAVKNTLWYFEQHKNKTPQDLEDMDIVNKSVGFQEWSKEDQDYRESVLKQPRTKAEERALWSQDYLKELESTQPQQQMVIPDWSQQMQILKPGASLQNPNVAQDLITQFNGPAKAEEQVNPFIPQVQDESFWGNLQQNLDKIYGKV